MACLLILVSITALLASKIPVSEIIRILIVLFSMPLILFIGVKIALNESVWHFTEETLTIEYAATTQVFTRSEITYIRNLRRSGGNLIMIFSAQQPTYRCWRNKLFQSEDDLSEMQAFLRNQDIEYYDM